MRCARPIEMLREQPDPRPVLYKLSAEAVWRESSMVIRRTRTFVSTARITPACVVPDAFFQLIDTPRFRCPRTGQLPMDIRGTEAARTTDNDLVAVLFPFQDRARTDAKPSAYFYRD